MPSHIRNYVERVEAETKEVCDQFEEMNDSFISHYRSYIDESQIEMFNDIIPEIRRLFDQHTWLMHNIKNKYRRETESKKGTLKNGV